LKKISPIGEIPRHDGNQHTLYVEETVLEIRKVGLTDELRQLLMHEVSSLVGVKPDKYFLTADLKKIEVE